MTNLGHEPGPSLAPVEEAARIRSVDVLRGVAVLGILLMNIAGMGLPDPAYWDPSGWGGDTGWNLRAWWITSVGFEGTMRRQPFSRRDPALSTGNARREAPAT